MAEPRELTPFKVMDFGARGETTDMRPVVEPVAPDDNAAINAAIDAKAADVSLGAEAAGPTVKLPPPQKGTAKATTDAT